MKPLTIWTNHQFDPAHAKLLMQLTQPHRVIWSSTTSKSNLVAGARDPKALEADVLHGQPSIEDILESRAVRWVQLSSAGYTRYDRADLADAMKERKTPFCNASSLFDEPCAQHAMAMLLAMARSIPQTVLDQQHAKWNIHELRASSFLLKGQTVALVGYGAIGKRLAELLAPYHLNIVGFRRSVKGNESVPTHPIDQFDDFLPKCDIVINLLPAATSTAKFFNRERFAKLRKGAIYLNLGRGDTTDQDALVESLQSGQISQAYLDVTSPEPLPAGHALWKIPTCHITPHTAGGTHDEPKRMIEHFIGNLRRFERGEEVIDRVY